MISVTDRIEKTLWEKNKMLVTQVFKSLHLWLIVLRFNTILTAKVISWRSVTHISTNTTLISGGRENQGLFGKELNPKNFTHAHITTSSDN